MTWRKTKNFRAKNTLQAIFFVGVFAFSIASSLVIFEEKAGAIRSITFPVIGKSSYHNDFNATRVLRGRTVKHNAIDIIANKGQLLVAAVSGTIVDVQYPQPDWGYSVTIRDSAGWEYTYIHMNDDTPGTNDGRGGGMGAYAPDVKEGNTVVKGQLLGKLGDSGFSNGVPHLHFEMYKPNGDVGNPYESLKRATKLSKPVTTYPRQTGEFLPHTAAYRGGVMHAIGDVYQGGEEELVVGSGVGGTFVKIYSQSGMLQGMFAPNNRTFDGGFDVATGDVDNDGVDEIITGSGPGGSYAKVFESDGSFISRFAPHGTRYKAGLHVATGDVDNDGVDEIITATRYGAKPKVSVYETNGTLLRQFDAYDPAFKGGVNIAAGDLYGDEGDEIITGTGTGAPLVNVFDANASVLDTFHAYSSAFTGGVKVAAANPDEVAKDRIFTIAANKGSARIKKFSATGSYLGYSDYFGETWWRGPYDIDVSDTTQFGSLGKNRRSSIRQVSDF